MGWISWGNWNDWGEWSDVPPHHDTIMINTTYGDCIDVYAALEVKVYSGVWHESIQKWLYDCRLESLGKVALKSGMPPYVMNWGSYYSKIELDKVVSGDSAFEFGQLPVNNNFGAFPYGGSQPSYASVYEILEDLIELGIGQMNKYLGFLMSVSNIINELRGEPDDLNAGTEEQLGEYYYYEYPYNGAFSPESSCWYCWTMLAKSNEYIRFRLKYSFEGYEFLNPPNPGQLIGIRDTTVWTIPTPPPGETMTAKEKEIYGLIEVPVNEIDKRSQEFRLPSEVINNCKKSGKPLYVITNPEAKIESSKIARYTKKLGDV
ncbi:hypothetical protein [Methanolobus psychrotolerans]|uniref:hypothetical protein n=1 Tax=Methanolobus psychrotolerans TaxID=1874706 RepID=UPI000B91562D|nr:hypothetical protein [Methanolobus psychrotolerans]